MNLTPPPLPIIACSTGFTTDALTLSGDQESDTFQTHLFAEKQMRTLGITFLCTLLAIAISWQSQAEGLMADASPDKGVSFQDRPCTTQEYFDAEIQCGIIIVPENYDEPSSKSLHLPAMRIGPMNWDHMAVVVGGGGPGGQALHDDYIQWWASFRKNVLGERGILIVEQRGVGEKHSLRCPGLIELGEKIFSRDLTMDEEMDLGEVVARDCYRQFQLAGIDLQQYTTSTSARDFENIRRVLGISKLDLIGKSYGGMIAFEMIGTYPDSVRLAVLDSPSVPVDQISGFEFEVDLLFSQLADQCNESYSCGEYYGDMIQNMTTVLNRLEKAPLRVPFSNWQTLKNETQNSIVLNRDRFATAIILGDYKIIVPESPRRVKKCTT